MYVSVLVYFDSSRDCWSPNDHAETEPRRHHHWLLLLAFNIKWKTVFIYNCQHTHTIQHHSRSQNSECQTQNMNYVQLQLFSVRLTSEWVVDWMRFNILTFWVKVLLNICVLMNVERTLNIRCGITRPKCWYIHGSVKFVSLYPQFVYLATRWDQKPSKVIEVHSSYSLNEWFLLFFANNKLFNCSP